MIIVIADVDEIAALLGLSTERHPTIIRPQTSGPCVHYDPDGVYYSPPGGEHQDEPPVCAYPYPCDEGCPHLDDPAILCPVKDACYAMRDLARLRSACEERDREIGMDAAPVPQSDYVLAPRDPRGSSGDAEVPEFPALEPDEVAPYKVVAKKGRAPGHVQEWTAEEDAALLGAANRHEALSLYHERVPNSERSDAAIQRRWYDIREPRERARAARRDEWSAEEDAALIQASAVADVVGQFREAFPDSERSDKAITSRFYRVRTRADRLHEAAPPAAPVEAVPPVTRERPDLIAPLSAPIAPGDRVALVDDPGLVGTAVIVNVRSKFASVEFPDDDGPARVYPLSALRRVIV